MKQLWYHGTTKDNYESIMQSGYFNIGTYFTPYYNTAISMGGPYVFALVLDIESTDWQWRSDVVLSLPSVLHSVTKIKMELLQYNSMLQQYLNREPDKVYCETCNGYGDLNYLDDGHHLLPRGSSFSLRSDIVICTKCGGYGYSKSDIT